MSTEVTALTSYPYSAVTHLRVTFPDGSIVLGTGSLIGRNDILTATHLLYNPDLGGWASHLSIHTGVDYNSRTGQYESQPLLPLGSFRWEAKAWPEQTYAYGDNETLTWGEAQYDVALIGISEPIGDSVGWFGLAAGYNDPQWAYQIGYPKDSTGMMLGEAWVQHGGYSVYHAYASSDTDIMGPGSSGGPLYIYRDGSPYIIGVKSSGSATTSTWADVGLLYEQLVAFKSDNDYLLGASSITPTPTLASASIDRLIELYIAYFNRAPEYQGLSYWQSELGGLLQYGYQETQALDVIAEQFWPAAQKFSEITGYMISMSNFDFVGKVYGNVLGRPTATSSDRDGIQFWADRLTEGYIASRGELIGELLRGAHAYIDAYPLFNTSQYVSAYLENRLEVARYFAQDKISGALQGDIAVQAGIRALATVTSDPASVNASIELIAHAPSSGLDLI